MAWLVGVFRLFLVNAACWSFSFFWLIIFFVFSVWVFLSFLISSATSPHRKLRNARENEENTKTSSLSTSPIDDWTQRWNARHLPFIRLPKHCSAWILMLGCWLIFTAAYRRSRSVVVVAFQQPAHKLREYEGRAKNTERDTDKCLKTLFCCSLAMYRFNEVVKHCCGAAACIFWANSTKNV